jgi:hypothetical protein
MAELLLEWFEVSKVDAGFLQVLQIPTDHTWTAAR